MWLQELLERYFKIDKNTSATVIFTIIIFITGYIITAVFWFIKNYLSRRATRGMFITTLLSLIKELSNQEKGFNKLRIGFNTSSDWTFQINEFPQLAVFSELGYKEVFNSFFIGLENIRLNNKRKNAREKAFRTIMHSLSSIKFVKERSLIDFEQKLDKYNQYNSLRSETMDRLRSTWDNIILSFDPTLPPPILSYTSNLLSILKRIKSIPTRDRTEPFTAHRKIVLPIRILNKKNILLPGIKEFNDIALQASAHYQNVEMVVRSIRSQFKGYEDTLRDHRRAFNISIKILFFS